MYFTFFVLDGEPYATSVIEIEANAIFWVVQVAFSKGLKTVILEMDSSIFVRRDGNRVAHELARRALCDIVDEMYDGFVPLLVDSRALNDVMHLCNQ